jgi:glycosyltransferase involved in cell wall biosynthesis
MNYTLVYLKTANVNLVKDMGMIPYKLHKLYNYNSVVACYNYGEYTYLKDEVKGLKLNFVEKKTNNLAIDGAIYILKNAKKIDILQIFHVTLYSLVYAYIFKFLNPKGKIYHKLDCSHLLVERIKTLGKIRKSFLIKFLDKSDLISVEQEVLYSKIKELLPKQAHKIVRIPNGVDFDFFRRKGLYYNYEEKENIILNVARIGAVEKNTPLLLEAFARVWDKGNNNWILKLVGPIEIGFEVYIENYFNKYPYLKNRVIFTGEIKNREKLYEEYKKAKIFSLTSQFESVAFAFIEAAAFGNVIVSTDIGIVREIVTENNGDIVPVGDLEELSKALCRQMNSSDLEKKSKKTYDICLKKYDWNVIVKDLFKYLNEK